MPEVRVIPGAVDSSSLRALVLARAGTEPATSVRTVSGHVVPSRFRGPSPQPNAGAAAELAAHGVALFTLTATGLKAGEAYDVVAESHGERAVSRVRTLPDRIGPEGLTIAVGSCFYEAFNRAAGYLAALKQKHFSPPAFKLLVGDNFYADVGKPRVDRSGGYGETFDDYVRYFWWDHYGDVLAYLPTLTTWDDHEYWNNFPESQPWLSRTWFMFKKQRQSYVDGCQEGLRLFQAVLNPAPIVPNTRSYVVSVPPLSFFVADLRSGRTLHDDDEEPRAMFSASELEALEKWASKLEAPGVLVVGQPLWMEHGSWQDYTPPDFEREFARIWRAIATAPHDILIVSGDVHFSRVIEIYLNNRVVHEFVTSPASHIPSLLTTGIKTYSKQDRGKVEIEPLVDVDQGLAPGVRPRLGRYLMGTDAPNSIAHLHFRSSGTGGIDVGGAFLDLDGPVVAHSSVARILKSNRSEAPVFSHCAQSHLFTLK